jgi:hypothetical protein
MAKALLQWKFSKITTNRHEVMTLLGFLQEEHTAHNLEV